MIIRKGEVSINKKTKKAIIEYVLNNYTIFVFQGNLSKFDILIKYNNDNSRMRTPKHIHWVVDVLMKIQGDKNLTKQFLNCIKNFWNSSKPLENNDFETLKNVILDGEKYINLESYTKLNGFGEFDIEFLYVLMELLSVQEKTNNSKAYMFGSIIDELLQEKINNYKIVYKADFRKRG